MGDDVRRASIGLILLLAVGTIHRYASFSNNANFGQLLTNDAPSEMSAVSTSQTQFNEDVTRQRSRIAALQLENKLLRDQQDKMLAEVSKPMPQPQNSISQVDNTGLRGSFSERKLEVSPPSSAVAASISTDEGWGGVLRGHGLGEMASAALAKATASLTNEVVDQAPPPSVAISGDGEGATESYVGSRLTFQSVTSKQFLSLDDKGWIVPDVDSSSALASKSFLVVDAGGGWVGLQCTRGRSYLEMVPKSQPLAWVVRASLGSSGSLSYKQQWRLEKEGRLFNRESQAYVNIIGGANAVRGHGNAPNKKSGATADERTTMFTLTVVAEETLAADAVKQKVVLSAEAETEKAYHEAILQFPASTEKRVVSYGLYGSNPKYTTGAIRNSELVKVWFPGWVARFYCDNSVPPNVIKTLKENGAEIVTINDIKGGIAGMFWRFLVADDNTVDRYIIRDTDSRLNPRERFAVEDWIRSGKGVHSIRDHPNHERPLNGGLWGGTKGSVKGITEMVRKFSNKGKYGGDLTFLNEKVWPQIRDNQISHDAYSCKKFPNAHPFPTKRPSNYQHVGQVFFEDEKFRAGDINGFMRGREVPPQCRKNPQWKYG